MNISPVANINFKGLTKKASKKLIEFSESLSPYNKADCLKRIEAFAKKTENSHTDIDYGKGFAKIYKNSMTQDPKDLRLGTFEGLKIIDKSGKTPKTIAFMPIRGLFTVCAETRVNNGGTYEETENGETRTAQCFGLYPERFSDFMDKLNRVVDINEKIIPGQPRSAEEIQASILSHSV